MREYFCTVCSLKALLEECDHTTRVTSCQASLVLDAALADSDCEKKVELLVMHGLPVNTVNSFGTTLLHLGAAKCSLRLLELAASGPVVNANVRDSLHSTPLHCLDVGEMLEDRIRVFDCVTFLARHNADLNAVNSSGDSPLVKALAAGQEPVVRALVKAGAIIPSVKMAERLDLDQVSVLAKRVVIADAKRPLVMALQVGGLMQRLAAIRKLDEEEYLRLSRMLESSAIAMVHSNIHAGNKLNEEVLFVAVQNCQKKVKSMDELLTR